MKKIDFHTHVFPDKIAPRALETLAYRSGGLVPTYDGTVNGLLARMERENVDVSVALGIATNPRQMKNVNDFAASVNGQKLIAFGSVHPDAPDVMDELERIRAMGLQGVKFHPEYQSFYVDDEKMFPIYKKIGELGLITIFHAGGDIGFDEPYHCAPDRAARIVDAFAAPVVFAHWGGWLMGGEVIRHLAGKDCYFDVSFGYGSLAREQALKIVEKHGVDRLLLGSDGPWHTIEMEERFLSTLELSEREKEKIYYKNAQILLNR